MLNYLKNEEYLKYITKQEKLNTKLLNSIFDGGYRVVGVREEKFIKPELYRGNLKKQKLKSWLRYVPEGDFYQLEVRLGELNFENNNSIINVNCSSDIKIENIGTPYKISGCINLNNQRLNIVLLNKSFYNSVYAIGFKTN